MGKKDGNLKDIRVAVADLGTNSLIWLIADIRKDKILPVNEGCLEPRLGENLSQTGEISERAIERTLRAIEQFVVESGNTPRKVVATEVLRQAKNAEQFVGIVKEKLNIDIEVISQEKEAQLSFAGAIEDLDISGQCVVVDVGGGSTEIAWGINGKFEKYRSYKFGAVSLRDAFGPPPYMNCSDKIINKITDMIIQDSGLSTQFDRIVAVGGTASCVSAILAKKQEFNPYELHGKNVSITEWVALWKKIYDMRPIDIARVIPFAPDRADILPCGMAIYIAVAKKLDVKNIVISTKGLRYALAREFALHLQQK